MARLVRSIALTVAGVTLAGGALKHDVLYDYFIHDPTPKELTVGKVLLDAFGESEGVRCITPQEIIDRKWPNGGNADVIDGYTPYIWPPLIWLSTDTCSNVERFVERPAHELGRVSAAEISALRTLAHESRHLKGTTNESQAECEAAQVAYKIPLILGADEATSYMIGSMVAYDVWHERRNATGKYALHDCYEGGVYDLHETPSFFPPYQEPAKD